MIQRHTIDDKTHTSREICYHLMKNLILGNISFASNSDIWDVLKDRSTLPRGRLHEICIILEDGMCIALQAIVVNWSVLDTWQYETITSL